MATYENKQICIIPNPGEIGGPTSFIHKFSQEIKDRGIRISTDVYHSNNDVVLVVGGTKNILGLLNAKRRGVPIVQRLDGMNWIHKKSNTGIRHFFMAEIRNRILFIIRSWLASGIIYQSEFVKQWWEKTQGKINLPTTVIHNGVDLSFFSPSVEATNKNDAISVLMTEGHYGGGYEIGLEFASLMVAELQKKIAQPIKLVVVGDIAPSLQNDFEKKHSIQYDWQGRKTKAEIVEFHHQSDFLFSGDLQPECPNCVIEALASGLPILAYDTGAIVELVADKAGAIVDYGSDAWELEFPNINNLVSGALKILEKKDEMKIHARKRAKDKFSLSDMTDRYLSFLFNLKNN